MAKRDNYISWDEYFMGIAVLSAQLSLIHISKCKTAQQNTPVRLADGVAHTYCRKT